MELKKQKDLIEKGAELMGVSPQHFGRLATGGYDRYYARLCERIEYHDEKGAEISALYKKAKREARNHK